MLDIRTRLAKQAEALTGRPAQTFTGLFNLPPKGQADFCLPCFRLAKELKLPPQDLARQLAENWPLDGIADSAQAAGPYVNFRLHLPALLAAFAREPRFPSLVPADQHERLLVEYSQPNTHKAFHIGHIRNVAIGDSLVRLLRYNGHHVTALNYIGDIGAHIAKFLWYYQQQGCPVPEDDTTIGAFMGSIYVRASQTLASLAQEEKEQAQSAISRIQQQLEGRQSPELQELWQRTRRYSLQDFAQIYAFLNTCFDHVYYESDVEQEGIRLVRDLYEQGVLTKSQGAIVADLGEKLGVFLLLKSDGTSLYGTKEMSLAMRKQDTYQPDRSLYVVASEQDLYFRQVQATLRHIGFPGWQNILHLSYELVVLQDQKMSSRVGNIVSFHDLKDAVMERIAREYLADKDWPQAEKDETAYRIALATLRYGMLSKNRNKKVVFNLEGWLRPEGDTGAYILYTITRINSILEKCPHIPAVEFPGYAPSDIERSLVMQAAEFSYQVLQAEKKLEPALLANYAFSLCKLFNRFYHNHPVSQAKGNVFAFRFHLIRAVRAVLLKAVELMGFKPVARM